MDAGSWVVGLGFRSLGSASQVLSSGFKPPKFLVLVHSVIITKCDKELLQIVPATTRCDSFYTEIVRM